MRRLWSLVLEFLQNRLTYLRYVVAIFRPGHPPKLIQKVDQNTLGSLTGWTVRDLEILVEEGRRADDAGLAALADLRKRAQLAFSTCLLLLGALAAQLRNVRAHQHPHHHRDLWWLYGGSVGAAIVALAGSLAVLVIQLAVPEIHPAVLSRRNSPVQERLARDYAENAIDWNRVNGTTRTVLREGILYLTLAGLFDFILWIRVH